MRWHLPQPFSPFHLHQVELLYLLDLQQLSKDLKYKEVYVKMCYWKKVLKEQRGFENPINWPELFLNAIFLGYFCPNSSPIHLLCYFVISSPTGPTHFSGEKYWQIPFPILHCTSSRPFKTQLFYLLNGMLNSQNINGLAFVTVLLL